MVSLGKRNNVSKLKGELDIDLENDEITLTLETKEGPKVYDLLSELAIYEGKFINITITEDIDVDPIN